MANNRIDGFVNGMNITGYSTLTESRNHRVRINDNQIIDNRSPALTDHVGITYTDDAPGAYFFDNTDNLPTIQGLTVSDETSGTAWKTTPDLPVVSFAADSSAVGAASFTLNLTIASPSSSPLAVGVKVLNPRSNVEDGLYLLSKTFTIPANATTYQLPLTLDAKFLTENTRPLVVLDQSPNYITGRYTFTRLVEDDGSGETGSGLQAAYFTNKNLSGTSGLSRLDSVIDFSWQGGSPAPNVPQDNFSVRWTGQVQAQYGEEYTFYTRSDDGVRLWVNGQQIINNWTDHAVKEDQGKISLQAGQKYDIRLEYYEKGGQAVCQLRWSSASQPKQVVPQPRLYPATVDEPSTATYTIRARGLQGTEEMALQINGQTVQSWTVSTTMAVYTYTGEETGTVRVAIINDQGVNHDLQVDKLTVDGTVYQAEAQAVNTGVWQGQCGGSFSEWLHCPGHIEFDLGGPNARLADQPTKKLLTESLPEIRLFPNPSPDGSFTVQGIVDGRQVNLYDLQGRSVAITTQAVASQRLQVQSRRDLPKGLYLLRIQQTNGKGWQSKVVVE